VTSLLAAFLAIIAAGVLLAAGYLIGIRRARAARDALRQRLQARDSTLRLQLQELTTSLQRQEANQRLLEADMKSYLDRLSEAPTDTERIREDLSTMIAPLLARERDDVALRTTMQELLGPIVAREQLGYELAHLELGTGERGELPRLLDDIAERGNLATVMLSDDAGLPLAVSDRVDDLERLTGLCSLVMLVVDRLGRDEGPALRAVMVHDDANHFVLNRVFEVGGQQLLLTAVATGTTLSPNALDPALVKLESILVPART